MDKQQLDTMLFNEKFSYLKLSIKSHPKRRVIADYLNKVCFEIYCNKIVFFVFY
jgi:hypothetical protein